jgi:hypothetical protein
MGHEKLRAMEETHNGADAAWRKKILFSSLLDKTKSEKC